MKNESKKANAKLTSVLAAVLIIVVAIVAVIAVKTKDSGSLGTHSCEIMSGDNSSTVFEITFNEKNNTYKENISVGDKAVELASGTFVMDGNKLTLPEAIINKLNGREGEMTLGIRGDDLKMDAQNLELYKENKMRAVITDTEVMK